MYKFISHLLLLLVFAVATHAQDARFDVILKTNGDEMKGKVTEVTDDAVKFTYAGETVLYSIKKTDIQKITFASGRVETFTAGSAAPAATLPAANSNPATTANATLPASTPEERRNKIAILPFAFTRDGQPADEQLSMGVQDQVYDLLNKHAGIRSILPPRRTNVVLNKAGITPATIMNYTMDELCNVLGVEFIIDGTIAVNRTSQTSYVNSSGNEKSKSSDKNGNSSSDNKSYSNSSYATTEQHYASTTEMRIYNDTGATVYNQHRNSLLNYQDAYKSTVEYLLKRCPLYTR